MTATEDTDGESSAEAGDGVAGPEATPEGVPAPTAPVEAVLFDLDGTVCEYDRDGADILAETFEVAGVEPFFSVDAYYNRYDKYDRDDRGIDEIRERAFAEIAGEHGREAELGRRLARIYSDNRDHRDVSPLPGAVEAVERFRERYRVGLVTNGGPEMQARKLESLGLDDAFEVEVFAGHGGVAAKPDPEPFAVALSALSVAAGRAVYVGNSHRADVTGATRAGLRSVHVSTVYDDPEAEFDPDPRATFRVRDPRGLLPAPWEG